MTGSRVRGLSAGTCDDLCDIVKSRFVVSYTDHRSVSCIIQLLGFLREKARPHYQD